jgi:serine/threonine protein kinase
LAVVKSMVDILVEAAKRRGSVIGRNYVLDDVLGVGGMGIVFSAVQRSLGRPVAIKVPHPDQTGLPGLHARFRREALVAGRLWHRNIISVIDYGDHDGAPYLVMERVHGLLLGRVIADHGAVEVPVAIDLAAQVLDALAETHAAGFIHADVKPDNILVEERRDGSTVARLFDFGLACDRWGEHPLEEVVYGTPEYMAPEVIRGESPCCGTDLYGAGVLLYELLTGATPFAGAPSSEILNRHLHETPLAPSRRAGRELPAALDAFVLRLLAKHPEARRGDSLSLSAELRAALPIAVARTRTPTQRYVATVPHSEPHDTVPVNRIDALRTVATATVARGNDDQVVDAYLALARALVEGHQPLAAAKELEIAFELLELRAQAGRRVGSLWCVLTTLAAVYSHLGQTQRARAVANAAHLHAQRVGSVVGQRRAQAIFARLVRGRTSVATSTR